MLSLNKLTQAKWLYPLCILISIFIYLPTNSGHYHFPDNGYLNARYARNLINGEGFVYNPDEKALLTHSPLIVLTHAAVAVPEGEIHNPPGLLSFILLAIALAAVMRVLVRSGIIAWIAIPGAVFWLFFAGYTFGSEEWWLSAFTLVTLDFTLSEKWHFAALTAGLMILISPLAVIFVILMSVYLYSTGLKPDNAGAISDSGLKPTVPQRISSTFWKMLVFWIPGILWYGFAYAYFGSEGLNGLTLPSPENGQGFIGFFPGIYQLILLIPVLYWLTSLYKNPHVPPHINLLIVWLLLYNVLAVLLHYPDDITLLTLFMMLATAFGLHIEWFLPIAMARHTPFPGQGSMIALVAVIAILSLAIPEKSENNENVILSEYPEFQGSVLHDENQEFAFQVEGAAYHMGGLTHPQLYDLAQTGDVTGLILATAPDIILPDITDYEDNALALLYYEKNEVGYYQRGVKVYPWRDLEVRDIAYGPDLMLRAVALDRNQVLPGELFRLRLDWDIIHSHTPNSRLLFLFHLLDYQQVTYGSISQEFPAEKWQFLETSTYHVIPVEETVPPGLYTVNLAIDYQGGIIDRQTVATIKIPAPTDVIFENAPLARFGNQEKNQADLMMAEIQQNGDVLEVNLTWLAQSPFTADYVVFVHLTAPDDVTPFVQGDSPPDNDSYPTSIWEKGEVIEDSHSLNLAEVPPGEYVIRVGFWDPEQGRIPGLSGQSDSVVVSEKIIKP